LVLTGYYLLSVLFLFGAPKIVKKASVAPPPKRGYSGIN
jgi:hypothetical protein